MAPEDVDLILNRDYGCDEYRDRAAGRPCWSADHARLSLRAGRSPAPGPRDPSAVGWFGTSPRRSSTRDWCARSAARIDATGTERRPLDEQEVRNAVRELLEQGVEAITVSLIHGYLRPDLEATVGGWAAQEAPGLPISLASSVLPEPREYERTLVVGANADVQPATRRRCVGRWGAEWVLSTSKPEHRAIRRRGHER